MTTRTLLSALAITTVLLPGVAAADIPPPPIPSRITLPSGIPTQLPIGDAGASALKTLIDAATLRLTSFDARIQESSAYSAELKAALHREVEREIAWLATQQAAVTAATTLQQVRDLAQQVRDHYEQVRFGVKRTAGEMIVAALELRIAALEELSATLARGAGYVDITEDLAAADAALDAARSATVSARASFQKVVSRATVEPNYTQGMVQVRLAQQQLVTARKALARALATLEDAPSPL